MTKILGGFFHKIVSGEKKGKETQNNEQQDQAKNINDQDLKTTSECQHSYGKALINTQQNAKNKGLTPEEIQQMSPEEKQAKLDKAGFSQDVIENLKQKSKLYGTRLIDEVLNMAIYIDSKYDAGVKVTKNLVESTIDKFSPNASGGSATSQRIMLAKNWIHGDEIYKAYGKTPPINPKKIEKLSQEEKQAKLDKAGFTEDVIADLKQKSNFYGTKLIDEVLNMAIYLETEYAKGTKITMQLLDNVVDAFSPGASGGSAATQLRILAENWTHGKEIKQAYK